MICMMCGRELPEDAVICKGCGSPQRRQPRPKPTSLGDTLKGEVKIGKKIRPVWQICTASVVTICLLCLIGIYGPSLWTNISGRLDAIQPTAPEPEQPQTQTAAEIDHVSGAILALGVNLSDVEDAGETAYDDGSWERDWLFDSRIKIRFIRLAHEADWTSTHLRRLYPDVTELESFPMLEDVSGYPGMRYQISSTTQAESCVVELLMVNTDEYDHFFIVEIPTDVFFDYEKSIDDWMSRLTLVDAQTLVELPSAVSSSDVSGSDVSDSDMMSA